MAGYARPAAARPQRTSRLANPAHHEREQRLGPVRVSLFPLKLNENERTCALGFSASPSGSVRIDALIRPPPQVLHRGSVARSSRMTRLPARAASRAALAPAGPAPITAMSQISVSVTHSFTSSPG